MKLSLGLYWSMLCIQNKHQTSWKSILGMWARLRHIYVWINIIMMVIITTSCYNNHLSYLIPNATKASFWLVFGWFLVCDNSNICMTVMRKCRLKLLFNYLSFCNSKPNVNRFNKMLQWAISKIKNLQIAWQMNEIYMR